MGCGVTRAELVAALEIVLDPYPVVAHPFEAVAPPAFALEGSTRERGLPVYGGQWQVRHTLLGIASRMDDVDGFDTSETMQDVACAGLEKLSGTSDWEQDSPPARETIGQVDYLTFRFTFIDHNALGPCS